jgi:uncharacterized membrane protein required for colicin V production
MESRREGTVNELDYILLIIILTGVGIGLRRGLIRVLISTIGIYFSVVVAGYAYQPLGDILSNALDDVGIRIGIIAAHNFIYIVVMIAMTVTVEVVSRTTFEETRITSLRGLDTLLGGLAGIYYGVLWAALFLVAPQYGISQTGGGWSTAVSQSALVPRLNDIFQNGVLDVVSILFIGGTPELYLNGISRRVAYLWPFWANLGRCFL